MHQGRIGPVVQRGPLAWCSVAGGATLILRTTMTKAQAQPIQITGPIPAADRSILTFEAISFLNALSHKFEERRQQLLERRRERQQEIDRGVLPQFLAPTAWVGDSDWVAPPTPADRQ